MAFVSMIMVYLFLAVVFIIGLFILGLILLIVGLVTKKIPKNRGKKAPKVCIVIGSVFMAIPVCIVLWFVISWTFGGTSDSNDKMSYGNVTDTWRTENVLYESSAADEVVSEMLKAADSGDKDAFAHFFTPELLEQYRPNSIKGSKYPFEENLDDFFEAYPKGLSECKLEGGSDGSTSPFREDEPVRKSSASYTCTLNGEWYRIYFTFCFRNTESPDEVGVTFFSIENLQANALHKDYVNCYIVCSIIDESEISARLIDGNAFIFKPTPERSITLEQMQTYLEEYDSLDKLTGEIGEPNVEKKYQKEDEERCDYYYELAPEDGKPMYMYICANTSTGEILYTYPCSDTEEFSDPVIDS